MQPSNTAVDVTAADNSTDLRALMEKPPGGLNYGRVAVDPYLSTGNGRLALSVEAAQERDLLAKGGWSVIDGESRRRDGVTAHRGTLHPDEHVATAELRRRFEDAFGFTFEEVRSVYRQGRLDHNQGELRARIDARLLALSRAGANMMLLSRLLGFQVDGERWPKPLRNAITRAKAAEREAA